jgi:hypothetical protein
MKTSSGWVRSGGRWRELCVFSKAGRQVEGRARCSVRGGSVKVGAGP